MADVDLLPSRASLTELEQEIAAAEVRLARYRSHLERQRATGYSTAFAKILVQVAEARLRVLNDRPTRWLRDDRGPGEA